MRKYTTSTVFGMLEYLKPEIPLRQRSWVYTIDPTTHQILRDVNASQLLKRFTNLRDLPLLTSKALGLRAVIESSATYVLCSDGLEHKLFLDGCTSGVYSTHLYI